MKRWSDSLAFADPAGAKSSTVVLVPIGTYNTSGIAHLPDSLTISRALADELVANFDAKVMKTSPYIDDGKHLEDKATAWITRLWVGEFPHAVTGAMMPGLLGEVEWTSLGESLVADRQYRYLSVLIAPYTDEETGDKFTVVRSATLTNKPVMKMMPEVTLAAGAIGRALGAVRGLFVKPLEAVLSLSEVDEPVVLGDIAAKMVEEKAEAAVSEVGWQATSAFRDLVKEAAENTTGPALDARIAELAAEYAAIVGEAAKQAAAADIPEPVAAFAAAFADTGGAPDVQVMLASLKAIFGTIEDATKGKAGVRAVRVLRDEVVAKLAGILAGKEGQDMTKLYDGEGKEINLAEVPEVVETATKLEAAVARLAEIDAETAKGRIDALKASAVERKMTQPTIDQLVSLAESDIDKAEAFVATFEVVPAGGGEGGSQLQEGAEIALSEIDKQTAKQFGLTDEQMLAAKKTAATTL